MRCELCGNDVGYLKPVLIEGTEMQVCPACASYGTPVTKKKRGAARTMTPPKIEPYSGKDVFKDMDKELVDNYGARIREARERQGMSREELGARIGEKTTAVAKMENQELRPSDKKARQLEKTLHITLFQSVEPATVKKRQVRGLTIGDLLKNND